MIGLCGHVITKPKVWRQASRHLLKRSAESTPRSWRVKGCGTGLGPLLQLNSSNEVTWHRKWRRPRYQKFSRNLCFEEWNTIIFAYNSVEKTFRMSNERCINPPSSKLRFRWSSREFTHGITDIRKEKKNLDSAGGGSSPNHTALILVLNEILPSYKISSSKYM